MILDRSRPIADAIAGFVPAGLRRALLARPELREVLDAAERDSIAHRRALADRIADLRRAGDAAALQADAALQAARARHEKAAAAAREAADAATAAEAVAIATSHRHRHAIAEAERALRESADPRILAVRDALADAWLGCRHLPAADHGRVAPRLKAALPTLDAMAMAPMTAAEVTGALAALLAPIETEAVGLRDAALVDGLTRARRAIGEGAE